jgi:uncharacterized protein (TIGR03546 family)
MFLLRPFRWFFKTLVVVDTPHQLAFGLALGVLVGLVPKGNLLAVGLIVILCSLRVNLGSGLLSAFACSWAGELLDPITDKIGVFLLKHEQLQPLWTQLYDTSVVPWTNFNNTIVLGSFVLGLALFVPVYFGSRPIFAIFMPRLSAWVKRFHLASLLMGGKLTGKVT